MKRVDGSEWHSSCGLYMNLKGIGESNAVDAGLYVYEPEFFDARSSHVSGQVSPPSIKDDGSSFTQVFLRRGIKPV